MATPVVGENLLADNPNAPVNTARVSVYGNSVNSLTPGESFEDTLNGQTQIFHTVTPLAILLAATGGNVPTLWNPSTSGRIFIPKKLILAFGAGTTTISSIQLALTAAQAGTTVIASTGPIITFTEGSSTTTKFNGGIGAPNAKTSQMKWAPAVCTFVAAPTVFMGTEINLGAVAPTNGGNNFCHRFNGEVVLWPGYALSVVCNVATTTSTFSVTLIGVEKPIPTMR